jgi:hypothetical protein
VLTLEEKARVRRHGGWPNISAASTYFLGNPAAMEPFFILEAAMDAIIPSAEFLLREALDKCDRLANIIFDDADTLVASEVGDIKINPDQFEKVVQRYLWTVDDMLQVMSAYRNPFDARFAGNRPGGINVSVG